MRASIKRSLAALLILLSPCVAVAEPAARPKALETYIKDGLFDPGDYGWMRGRFAGADATQKAEWESIKNWNNDCTALPTEKVRSELKAMGVDPIALGRMSYGDPICAATSILAGGKFDADITFDQFLVSAIEAKAIFDTYLAGSEQGSMWVAFSLPEPLPNDVARISKLVSRDQTIRSAFSLPGKAGIVPMNNRVREAFVMLVGLEMDHVDRASTTILKAYVAEKGWPTISAVGKGPSNAAWLMVQHADNDPAFQLKALRLMEPLLSTKDVSLDNYAYLYDRVMLKIIGKQRYATQFWCSDGVFGPQPLEDQDPAKVDRLRDEMGIGPLKDYRQMMVDRGMGKC